MVIRRKTIHPFLAPEESTQVTVLIHNGGEFEGKLCFEGIGRIDGRFKGQIYTKDILIIGEGALVEADIEADVVVVRGNLLGKVTALNRIELKTPGVLKGEVCTPVFSMDEGVIFEGRAKMMEDSEELAETTVLQ